MVTPILMLGAGRMGGAILDGWALAQAFPPAEVMIRDPQPGPQALAAQAAGARLNPPDEKLATARTVLVCVKPQLWKAAAAEVSPLLAWDAVIISVAAGVRATSLSTAFGGRSVARVMPTTAAAIGQGTASLFAETGEVMARARALFDPLGTVVELTDENQMHAATGVSGSAPAYLYAFIEALEGAGAAAGLAPQDAAKLARSTITGAAALLARTGDEPAELRRQVTSPGGTTEAALNVLLGSKGFPTLLREAVAQAVRRSKELGA